MKRDKHVEAAGPAFSDIPKLQAEPKPWRNPLNRLSLQQLQMHLAEKADRNAEAAGRRDRRWKWKFTNTIDRHTQRFNRAVARRNARKAERFLNWLIEDDEGNWTTVRAGLFSGDVPPPVDNLLKLRDAFVAVREEERKKAARKPFFRRRAA